VNCFTLKINRINEKISWARIPWNYGTTCNILALGIQIFIISISIIESWKTEKAVGLNNNVVKQKT